MSAKAESVCIKAGIDTNIIKIKPPSPIIPLGKVSLPIVNKYINDKETAEAIRINLNAYNILILIPGSQYTGARHKYPVHNMSNIRFI